MNFQSNRLFCQSIDKLQERKIKENEFNQRETDQWTKHLQSSGQLSCPRIEHLYSRNNNTEKLQLSNYEILTMLPQTFHPSLKPQYRRYSPKEKTSSGKISNQLINNLIKSVNTCNSNLLNRMTDISRLPKIKEIHSEIKRSQSPTTNFNNNNSHM
jgi:hypothetical protein